MFRVQFANPQTFAFWVETFPTYTAAWIAFLSYRDLPTPEKRAIFFLA